MDTRTTVLLVGNHVEPEGVLPRPEEFVIVCNVNANKIAQADMLATSVVMDNECPHKYRFYGDRVGRPGTYTGPQNRARTALRKVIRSGAPAPTIGFLMLVTLELTKVPVRVAGFSWYAGKGESGGIKNHKPQGEREYVKRVLRKNPLFYFTQETLRWLE